MMYKSSNSGYVFRIVVLLLVSLESAHADYQIRVDELRSMPPICHSLSAGNFDAEALKIKRPKKSSDAPHLQHYCHGMKYLTRAMMSLNNKKFAYTSAIDEFGYVLSHTSNEPRYAAYLASTFMNRATALAALQQDAAAIADYYKAIELKPGYSQAYAKLSDYFKDKGNKEEAIKTINAGLKQVPKSKSLLRRKRKLEDAH